MCPSGVLPSRDAWSRTSVGAPPGAPAAATTAVPATSAQAAAISGTATSRSSATMTAPGPSQRPAPAQRRLPTGFTIGSTSHPSAKEGPPEAERAAGCTRVGQVFPRMKNWKILQDCRRRGDGMRRRCRASTARAPDARVRPSSNPPTSASPPKSVDK